MTQITQITITNLDGTFCHGWEVAGWLEVRTSVCDFRKPFGISIGGLLASPRLHGIRQDSVVALP
jgi:hypothetical protein